MIRFLKNILPILLLAFLLVSSLTGNASAAESEARQALEKTINDVLKELQDPALKNTAGRDAVLKRVEAVIDRLFDFEELSARTVGPNWRTFSKDQQERFIEAFNDLLRATYTGKLEGYEGEQVSYLGETTSTKGDKVEIKTTVNVKDKPVPVAYRMLNKKRGWVVYDVIIEGVSMVQNYRTQFQDLLAKGDAEALIKRVEAKAVEVQNSNTQKATQ